MELTPHQQQRKREILRLVNQGHKRVVLIGSAGTGKTVLVGNLVKIFNEHPEQDYNPQPIYVTAPTNKAVAVLQTKVEPGENIIFKTIDAALELKKYDNSKTGERTFVRSMRRKRKPDDLEYSRVCFIDEASMLNGKIEGKDGVEGYLEDHEGLIIYIGDDKQLNPIGEPFSPVFHKGYPTVELTEIVRQDQDNPIIELSRNLDMIPSKRPKIFAVTNGVKTISNLNGYLYTNKIQSIIDNLAMVNGTDDLKYLAYTNKDVDKINFDVRRRRYGNPAKLELEETIVFNAPYYRQYYTNQEVKVTDLDIVINGDVRVPTSKTRFNADSVPINNEFDKVKMKWYRVNNSFDVIHEDAELYFKRIVKELVSNCVNLGWDWKCKFWFVEQFADIKYNHAITVHKSQGSTYKEAVLNIMDIDVCKYMALKAKTEKEKEDGLNQWTRLLYTAVTRPSNLVILHNVK